MPLCAYQDARMRSDETVIENAFIREYMPFAPNNCLKVYLYGLMQCQSGVGESTALAFAHALGMDEMDVTAAFEYWHERGLVNITEHPAYAVYFNPVRSAMPRDVSVYEYADLNDAIQRIFSPRVATPSELSRIYDWLDVFSIERDAIPALLDYGRSRMKDLDRATIGNQVRYIDRIASQWAEEGIRTLQQAEEWIAGQQQHSSGITALMRKMGMHRAPMDAEKKMYNGWLKDGFSPDAILAAADKMTGVFNPSFKYLNVIIQDLLAQGSTDEQSVRAEQNDELCREALTTLGIKNKPPNATQMRIYRECMADGFSHEHMLQACEICNERGKRSIKEAQRLLHEWREKGLNSLKEIREYERNFATASAHMADAFSCMGIQRGPCEADVKLYNKWTGWGMDDEMILYAAECSHGASSPYKYMQKLLGIWHKEGVGSVSEARKNHEEWQGKAAAPPAAKDAALDYQQHSYKPGELDHLFDEL